ncbi:IS21 family transposase [Desulfotignum phosphitoxidans]|uniref:Intergrase for insertion sequence element IS5376 n=1 Tax=Desulfotignum phosphitoxidans DSM 13687 TaxID=1286635 RepID=S0G5V6_9BACT|nr:IS21 family transposase [Desulfotignum phosphitoxidans]EMS79977.1 intergrase for insertion sequence element IS5376 [Desulfotignum phosphitoxidans DSM 13687]
MIDKRTVFEIHRLNNMQFSIRQIARQLGLDRGSVKKYLEQPDITCQKKPGRVSKLDPYRDLIREMVNDYPQIKAPVVLQHIRVKGFTGEITIVRDYLKQIRHDKKQAFIRFESRPGEQFQIDWGHFGSLTYGKSSRKLYALAVIESHSRMLFVVFTHSQNQATLHRCLVAAFLYFGGTPGELVVDNMVTAVIERVGSMIRFNEAFLDFLRHFGITPKACNVRAPHEKGKVENSIRYLRNNFWPLRKFTDLDDVNHQVLAWLDTTANQRVHQTTGEKPVDRFVKDALNPLPDPLPDYRETETLRVYKDFGVRFDTNVYTVPPRLVGKSVILKADSRTISIYYKEKQVAAHTRKWEKNLRIDLPAHKEQVRKLRKRILMDRQMMVFMSLGQEAVDYLEKLTDASQPLKKTVSHLLQLQDKYGASSLIYALRKALAHKLYGSEYVENILHQEMARAVRHRPVELKNEDLNQIRLPQPNLAEYDALALSRRKK